MSSKIEIYLAQTYSISVNTKKIVLSPLLSSYVSMLVGKFVGKIEIDKSDVNHDVQFYIIYHSLSDLVLGNQYLFAQDYYIDDWDRKSNEHGCFYSLSGTDSFNRMNFPVLGAKLPMMHITIFDLLNESENMSYINEYICRHTSRFKAIMDSSIWNYYLPITVPSITIERFKGIVKKIHDNVQKRLYRYCVANEYVELNARLVMNSYLSRKLHAHGSSVSPFVFHSEYEIEKDLLKRLAKVCIVEKFQCNKKHLENEKLKETKIERYNAFCFGAKWRILLLDDYVNEHLKEFSNIDSNNNTTEYINNIDDSCQVKEDSQIVIGKLKIIIDDLQSIGCGAIAWCCPTESEIECRWDAEGKQKSWKWYDNNGNILEKYTDPDIAIVCAKTVKTALNLLAFQRYDIILLDYLLAERNDKKGREYSYYLLKILDELKKCSGSEERYKGSINESLCNAIDIKLHQSVNEKFIYQIENKGGGYRNMNIKDLFGPNGRLYFMHISAFVNAIQERLQEQHLLRSEPFWHIARGACPTNTPELFLYYLYRAMEKRYESVMMQGDECVGSLIDFLNEIFSDNPRMQCVNKFNTLLNLRAQYNRIKNDVYKEERELLKMKAGSELINGCSPLDCRSSRLICSIFKDILYYGNSFWEHLQHLIYLTAYGTIRQWTEMWEEYSFIKPRLMLNEEKGEKVCKAIEDYIIALKSNS